MFVMVVRDRTGYNNSTIKYKNFDDVAAHAQRVIAPQIAEEFTNTLQQDNPLDWKEQLEVMAEILEDLYSLDQAKVIAAIEEWGDRWETDNLGDVWIEWLG